MAIQVLVWFLVLLPLIAIGCTSSEMSSLACHQMDDGTLMGDCAGYSEELMVAHAESSQVEVDNLTITLTAFGKETSSPTTLTFTLNEISSGKSFGPLEIVHEKPLHLILVRDDLNYFDHLHPQEQDNGQFSIPYNFFAPGNYKLWIGFHKEKQYLVDFPLRIDGEEKIKPAPDEKVVVTLDASSTLVPGPALLHFKVQDLQGNPFLLTEQYLGAAAHLISISETLQEFSHGHDMIFDQDNSLSFTENFSKPGRYKLWVQFNAQEEVQTKEFLIMVRTNATAK